MVGAPAELRAGFAGGAWVAAFLDGVGAGVLGGASVDAVRSGLCERHRKFGDIIIETIAVLAASKAETLPAPPEAT